MNWAQYAVGLGVEPVKIEYDPHVTIPNDPVTFGCTRYVGVVAARLEIG